MGKKYVIEIEDGAFLKDMSNIGWMNPENQMKNERLYRVKGFKSLVFDEVGLSKLIPLEDYIRRILEYMSGD